VGGPSGAGVGGTSGAGVGGTSVAGVGGTSVAGVGKSESVKVGRSASSTKMVNRLRFALSLRRVTRAGALWAVKEQLGALWASEGTKYEGRSASWGSRRLGRRLVVDE
jgi:hypothetical protein